MTGMIAALVASTISSVVGVASLWIITLAFMDMVRHNSTILGAFQAQGFSNPEMYDRFIVQNANGASFFAPMLSLTLAMGVGAVGGLVGRMRRVHQLHA